ncbi:hypothetical protein WJX73_008945 [Symbiochloris irregularis]|uniref:Uncharacterized protein n=1 Tax=Symbiochloris irregularis TaxID=706552 RepID=A0AAW1NZX1_9CHLO
MRCCSLASILKHSPVGVTLGFLAADRGRHSRRTKSLRQTRPMDSSTRMMAGQYTSGKDFTGRVQDLKISPDNALVAGSYAGELMIYGVPSFDVVLKMQYSVTILPASLCPSQWGLQCFSPNGHYFAMCSWDVTAHIIRMEIMYSLVSFDETVS